MAKPTEKKRYSETFINIETILKTWRELSNNLLRSHWSQKTREAYTQLDLAWRNAIIAEEEAEALQIDSIEDKS